MDGQKSGWTHNLVRFWGGLKGPQRIGLIAGGVLVLALALYAGFWTQTPDYATLFSGLSEQDAAAVVEQLKTLKVPYRLVQGGAVIQVPQQQVYDVRLEMAKQGLPKGGTVGFELFDGGQLGNLGMTDFMQRVNYQRALEGELARTISSLEPVAGARVHIVVPEQSLFTSQQRAPTASVVLQLKPNVELTREHISAVTHLVASSIEGLKASNITLVDMQGNVLSAAGQDDAVPAALQASAGQLETKRAYERDLETRLQTMLDGALGPNHAIVRISAFFDWDQKETNSETYSPRSDGAGVVRSEQTQEEIAQGADAGAGGVPGVDSNTGTPTYPTAGSSAPVTYTKRSTTRNYEVSKVVQTVTQAPGNLQRLSVAVLMDDSLPMTRTNAIQAMVSAAAGVDTSRGDTIQVQAIPFVGQAGNGSGAALSAVERQTVIVGYAKLAGLALAILLLLRLAYVTFRELSHRLSGDYVPYMTIIDEESPSGGPAAPQLGGQAAPGLPGGAVPALAGAADSKAAGATAHGPAVTHVATEVPTLVLSDSAVSLLRKQLATVAQQDPELVAELIQSWLAESS